VSGINRLVEFSTINFPIGRKKGVESGPEHRTSSPETIRIGSLHFAGLGESIMKHLNHKKELDQEEIIKRSTWENTTVVKVAARAGERKEGRGTNHKT